MFRRFRNYPQIGGAKLPYDAEVDGIKGTGSNYVRTGIKREDDTGVYIEFMFDKSTTGRVFGCSEYGAGTSIFGQSWNGKIGCIWNYTVEYSGGSIAYNRWISAQLNFKNDRRFLANGTVVASNLGIANKCNYDMWLFARNNQGRINEPSSTTYIRKVMITKGEDVVMDLISVRKKGDDGINEGLFYDKVSEQFFSASGTGAFVIGPDK